MTRHNNIKSQLADIFHMWKILLNNNKDRHNDVNYLFFADNQLFVSSDFLYIYKMVQAVAIISIGMKLLRNNFCAIYSTNSGYLIIFGYSFLLIYRNYYCYLVTICVQNEPHIAYPTILFYTPFHFSFR